MTPTSTSTSNGPPQAGNLRQEPLARLLYRLYKERVTGILVVGEGTNERRVYLQEGQPVAAISAAAVEDGARVLLEMGIVTQDLYARSLLLTQETGEPQTAVLEQLGVVTDVEVQIARTMQSLETLIRLFRVRGANFSIHSGDHEYARARSERDPTTLDTRRVIYQGIRRCYDLARVRDEIGTAMERATFRIRRDATSSLAAYDFDEGAQAIVDKLCAGFWDPVSLDAMTGVGDLAVGRVLCALLATEALERRASEEAPALTAEPTPVQDLPAGPGSYGFSRRSVPGEGRRQRLTAPPRSRVTPPQVDEVRALRDRIETMSGRVQRLNYFELLGVGPDASREQIEAAYVAQSALFDVTRLASPDLSDVRRAGERILRLLELARASLLDEPRRGQGDREDG